MLEQDLESLRISAPSRLCGEVFRMIGPDAAIEIARRRAAENGWAFAEPLEIVHRRGWFGRVVRFEIETNAGKLGTKARFVIDASTGEVVSQGYVAR